MYNFIEVALCEVATAVLIQFVNILTYFDQVCKRENSVDVKICYDVLSYTNLDLWCRGLTRRPVTAKIGGSNPLRSAKFLPSFYS